MNGVLVIDKPQGPTSFDVVKQVRTLLKVSKAGHTGTLDPMATGVLPICVGAATRIAGYITEGDKAYEAVIKLGAATDTLDAEGKVTETLPVPTLDPAKLEATLGKFRGTFDQMPPMYSAIKVGGKRLYELARKGEEIERAARTVTVHELVLRDFNSDELRIFVRSSKGFFVRSLAQDLGAALGTVAHLKALRRTQSGPFSIAQAIPLDRLGTMAAAEVTAKLVAENDALSEMPALTVAAKEAERVKHGVPLEVPPRAVPTGARRVRVLGPAGELLALAELGPNGRLKYLRVLAVGDK